MFKKKNHIRQHEQKIWLILISLLWVIFILLIEKLFVTIEITDFQKVVSILLGWIAIILFWHALTISQHD